MEEYTTRFIRVESEFEDVKKIMGGITKKENPFSCDINDLANKIQDTCNDLYKNGYDVISIIPIIKGRAKDGPMGVGGYGWAQV